MNEYVTVNSFNTAQPYIITSEYSSTCHAGGYDGALLQWCQPIFTSPCLHDRQHLLQRQGGVHQHRAGRNLLWYQAAGYIKQTFMHGALIGLGRAMGVHTSSHDYQLP